MVKSFCVVLAAAALALAATLAPALAAAPVLTAPKPRGAATAPGLPGPAVPEKQDHGEKEKESIIETVELPSLPALAMTAKSTWEKGYDDIRSAIAALQAEALRLKLDPKGRPFVIYLETDDQTFRYDVLLPLAEKAANTARPGDGIRLVHNPGGKALKFEHRGAYADIESTYQAITALLDEKGLNARDFFIEEFVNDAVDAGDIKMAVNIYVFLK